MFLAKERQGTFARYSRAMYPACSWHVRWEPSAQTGDTRLSA